VSTVLLLLI